MPRHVYKEMTIVHDVLSKEICDIAEKYINYGGLGMLIPKAFFLFSLVKTIQKYGILEIHDSCEKGDWSTMVFHFTQLN